MNIDPLLNDLDFTFNPNDVDENDEDEIDSATLTTLNNGGGIYNTDNLNPYVYGYNNPVSFDDPDGRCPICPFIIAALLVSQSAEAPTGNQERDTKSRNATAGNNVLVPSVILGTTGSWSVISNASKVNTIRETIKKNKEKTIENVKSESQAKPRNKPETKGTPLSSKIESKDSSGKTTKYSTFDKKGDLKKQVQSNTGKTRHGISGATKKVPIKNTYPKTGNSSIKFVVKKASKAETPPGSY